VPAPVVVEPPVASFTWTPASPTFGQSASFTDTSTGEPTTWAWAFGDGGTSTARNPTHSYATCGSYTVTLTVTNAGGNHSATRQLNVVGCTSSCAARRALPSRYEPGKALDVSLGLTPPGFTQSYSVEEQPPTGWAVSGIDNGGVFEAATGKVRWGPFADAQPRTLHYRSTPPSGSTGPKTFSGFVVINGAGQAVCGSSTIATGTVHPADTTGNFTISIDEFTAYGSAWKSGATWPSAPNQIPIDYVTNAGVIWKNGENYYFDGSVNPPWVAGTAKPSPADSELSSSDLMISAGAVSSFSPNAYTPGGPVKVSIKVTPNGSTRVYAVEDAPPTGWNVSSIDSGGQFDAVNRKVKWGPAFDNQSRTFTYIATPPTNESGAKTFHGLASFDGASVAITGARTLNPAFSAWIPVASHTPGKNNTKWRSDLGILNTGNATANIEVRFFANQGTTSKTTAVAPGAQSILVDVVGQLGKEGSGAIEVRSDRPVKVSSTTYNDAATGTFGQDYIASTTLQPLGSAEVAFLPQLVEDANYRTNIALTNTSLLAASATVTLFDGAGKELASYSVDLRAGEWRQENQPFRLKAGQTNMTRGYARIRVNSGSGIMATASVINNRSNDPRTVVPVR
jgi:PKD repeat protein